MEQVRVTRPPRLRRLAEMRNTTSIFERRSSSFRSEDDYPEISTERRAKVKVGTRRDFDQESVMTGSSHSSSRAMAAKRPNRTTPPPTSSSPKKDGESIISSWSRPSVVKPIFEFDSASLLSSESTKSLLRDDTPWRAAKRGDLKALKQFQATGKVDWMAKDEFDNIPLYYACHTGALVDIMAVPFLLWVTSPQDQQILEKCKRNAVNRQVRSILKAYIKGGISGVVTNNAIASSVDSRERVQETKTSRGGKLTSRESTVVRQRGNRGVILARKDSTLSRINSEESKKETREDPPADKEIVDSRLSVPETKSSVTNSTATKKDPEKPPPSDLVVNIKGDHQDSISIIETTSQSSVTRQQSFEIIRSSPETSTRTGHSRVYQGSVDDHTSQRSSLSDANSALESRGRSGSLKSMLFGNRDQLDVDERKKEDPSVSSNSHASRGSRPNTSEDQHPKHQAIIMKHEQHRSTPSRLDDGNSIVAGLTKTRKPPISTNSSLSGKRNTLPPRPPPKQSTNDFVSWDARDERETERDDHHGNEKREDWDTPIEQHRYYGHQDTKDSMPPGISRDDDSWSIASMLSLKKWRNNKKQLDPEKIDKILFDGKEKDVNTTSGTSDPSSMRPTSRSGFLWNQPKGKVSNRGNFPKPYIEYHENEKTWMIGNQWKQNGNAENDKMIHVCDNRQRVHVRNCHGVNIHIHGRKMKAILVENSSDVNIIFDTVITTCEIVACSNVGIQVTGLCPTFSIDTTQGVTVWLTREAMTSSNFVTTKSHDVCISVPQGDDMHPWERKEVPLPVQYVHKFQEGGIMTHVPGKY